TRSSPNRRDDGDSSVVFVAIGSGRSAWVVELLTVTRRDCMASGRLAAGGGVETTGRRLDSPKRTPARRICEQHSSPTRGGIKCEPGRTLARQPLRAPLNGKHPLDQFQTGAFRLRALMVR